jgi:glycosyltransferase involved in cell wall biosynthesis
MLPKISAYCCTYARVKPLEEALYSFLNQDYKGPKELVILNDYDDQKLIFNHPEVKIYNTIGRFDNLGKKFNACVNLTTGDIILPWEDDDVYLSNRMTYTQQNMQNGYFHTSMGYFEQDKEKLVKTGNYFHCNCAFSRDLYKKEGGYERTNQPNLDQIFLNKMKKASNFVEKPIEDKDIFYVYRWSQTNSYHASEWACSETLNVLKNAKDIIDHQKTLGLIPQGDYELTPKWSYDYEKKCRELALS